MVDYDCEEVIATLESHWLTKIAGMTENFEKASLFRHCDIADTTDDSRSYHCVYILYKNTLNIHTVV